MSGKTRCGPVRCLLPVILLSAFPAMPLACQHGIPASATLPMTPVHWNTALKPTQSTQTLQASEIMQPKAENDCSMASTQAVVPFTIAIEDSAISDLQARLARTRLPDQLKGSGWEYGTELDYLDSLLDYWQNEFDWRLQESMLNEFDQYKTDIDGLSLHFIHQRSDRVDAIPLLLVHGWPGSISEFSGIIRPLVAPTDHGAADSDSFHVIAPSLPGFGFSGKPCQPGMNPEKIALLFASLMQRLGYERYALAGGDWGAIINRHLANHYPERLIGLHSNMVLAARPADPGLLEQVEEDEMSVVEARRAYMLNEVGYQQIQGTKPQTLGYGLADSPAGLAAWIVEKFHGWSDRDQGPDGNLDEVFSKDNLLTNISIYWFTNTITSSTRIYYENRNVPASRPMEYIDVPTGAAIFPAEIYIVPRVWAETAYDLRQWTVMEQGGHFAALEQPALYLEDLRSFFRLLR